MGRSEALATDLSTGQRRASVFAVIDVFSWFSCRAKDSGGWGRLRPLNSEQRSTFLVPSWLCTPAEANLSSTHNAAVYVIVAEQRPGSCRCPGPSSCYLPVRDCHRSAEHGHQRVTPTTIAADSCHVTCCTQGPWADGRDEAALLHGGARLAGAGLHPI